MGFTVAIDGPAASGKGSLARRLAGHYGFHHLDTGLTYRAVARALMDAGAPLDDESGAAALAARLDFASLDRIALASPAIGEAASRIAALPTVRAALLTAQRGFAAREPGAVLDGRDIGTVVCPGAPVKLFVTASPRVRAERRLAEIRANGDGATFDEVFEALARRDGRDANRAAAPLRPAAGAHLLDASEMDMEAVFRVARRLTDAALHAASGT